MQDIELDQDRMTRVMDAIAQNEVIISRLEEIVRSSIRVDPLHVDASSCTAEDFTNTSSDRLSSSSTTGEGGEAAGFSSSRVSVLEGDVTSFLARPHIGVLKLRLTLDRDRRLQAEEHATYTQAVSRIQLAALELRKTVAES